MGAVAVAASVVFLSGLRREGFVVRVCHESKDVSRCLRLVHVRSSFRLALLLWSRFGKAATLLVIVSAAGFASACRRELPCRHRT